VSLLLALLLGIEGFLGLLEGSELGVLARKFISVDDPSVLEEALFKPERFAADCALIRRLLQLNTLAHGQMLVERLHGVEGLGAGGSHASEPVLGGGSLGRGGRAPFLSVVFNHLQ
jgi:hypothetical protein